MKISGQELKVTLHVYGRKRTFTEQELIAILEKYFSSEAAEQSNVAQKPTEDEWFDVKPHSMDQKLFEKEREDDKQEQTRKSILEAFEAMKKYPRKYGENFKTMVPKKTRQLITLKGLKEIAEQKGDHIADEVEQALEWAQRIVNGESWETICNDIDNSNCNRAIICRDGRARTVGRSLHEWSTNAASYVSECVLSELCTYENVVPLIVSYED